MSEPRLTSRDAISADPDEKPPVQLVRANEGETHSTAWSSPAGGTPMTAGTLHHWVFLLLAGGVVVASAALSVRGEHEVVVPWFNRPLPGTCTFLRVTGLPCPGCGLTRSFISLAHGRPRDAWRFNPAGILFFAIVAFQVPYRAWQIARIRQGRDEHRFTSFDQWTIVGLIGLLLVQWLVTLLTRLW